MFSSDCEKKDFVLTVGRLWDAAKQVDLLLQQDCEVPACVVGCQDEPGKSRASSRNSSTSKAQFQDFTPPDQLGKLFAEAAIYAATSRYEPFGLAPVEAAFSRCAIVGNDLPVFRELWGDSMCYFATNDAADLAQQIRTLAADADLRRSYADAAYENAHRRFTTERMVDEYLELYANVTSLQRAA
jgi:glycogen(starch) synthase